MGKVPLRRALAWAARGLHEGCHPCSAPAPRWVARGRAQGEGHLLSPESRRVWLR